MKKIFNYLPFAALFILPLLFYPAVAASSWRSSSDVHALLEFGSSLLAVTAGIMVLLRFITSGRRFFMIISIGFVLIGIEEFVHAMFAFSRIWHETHPAFKLATSTTWLAGHLILISSLFIALIVGSREIVPARRIPYAVAYIITGVICAATLTLLIFNSPFLPNFVQLGSITKKLIELSIALLYFVAFLFYVNLYAKSQYHNPFIWCLIAFIIFRVVSHIFVFDSRAFYDSYLDMAHVMVFLSYFLPIFGIWGETMKIQNFAQAQVIELGKEISERKRAEEKVRALLAESNQVRRNMLSIIEDQKLAEEKLVRNFETQATMNKLMDLAMKDLGIDDFLRQALDLIMSLEWLVIEAQGSIFLADKNGETLRLQAQRGLAKPLRDMCGKVPFGHCLCGKAAATREVQFADDLDERHEVHYEGILPHGHYCVPILSGDLVLGVLNLYVKKGRARDPAEEEFLKAVANTLAGVIDRKRVEQELRESKALVDAVVENVPLMIFLKEAADLRFVIFNRAGEELLGYDRKALLGKNNLDLFPPEQAANFQAKDREVLDGELGMLDIPEEPILTARKGQRLLHTRKICIRGADGTTKFLLGISEDITERKNTEEKFQTIIQTAMSGFLLVDSQGQILDVNDACCQMSGYSRQEMLTMRITDLADSENPERLGAHMQEIIAQGKDRFEAKHRCKNGAVLDVEISIQYRPGEGGQFVAFIQDITERKRAQEILRRSHDELERLVQERTEGLNLMKNVAEAANQAKSEFLANMSHELRTPLGAIIGFSELLEEKLFGDLNPKQAEYVNDILGSGQHLLSLINDILDLAKIEAGKMELAISSFPVAPLIEDSLVMVKEKCLKQGISLVTDIAPPVKDLVISADERKLKQIMFNLLANAVKFSPDGSVIRVSANVMADQESEQSKIENQKSAILISISDTGLGIAKEHQLRIFEEFFQVANSAKGKPSGTGLGLPLVKRMVEQHGGWVWVESEGEGKGSTFRFTIPITPVQGLVQSIRSHLAAGNRKAGGFALVIFTLDADNKAFPAADKGKGAKTDEIWAALAEKVRALGLESAFSGNEFIVTTELNNNDDAVVLEKFRRLLKDVLFQVAPSAVACFSCGMARWTPKMFSTVELLEAARGAQVRERDRIAAQRIVIVDDEIQVRDLLRAELKQMGFVNIDEAPGGEDLFRLIQGQMPDLIVLDLYMPGMNGYEVIGRLKGHTPTAKIPILILSGRDVDSSKLQNKSPTTAIHVLLKPVVYETLNNHVSYLL